MNSPIQSDGIQQTFKPLHQNVIRRIFPWWLGACALGLLTPLMAQPLTDSGAGLFVWLLDLAAHWQWLFVTGLALGMIMTSFTTRRYLIFVLLLPLPWWTASQALPLGRKGAPLITVASVNLHVSTTRLGPLAQFLEREQPDIVVLLEVSRALGPQLAGLRDYSHQVVHPDDTPFGIALLSRFPLTRSSVQHDSDGIAHIDAEFLMQNQPLQLIAFHPMPPLSPYFLKKRDEALQAFAARLQSSGRPALLVGDLNATPWCGAFIEMGRLGLRRTTSLWPTWPAVGQGWFGIPIDHVLASSHWQIKQHHVGHPLGSDHLPAVVQLVLSADPPTSPNISLPRSP